MGLRQEDTWSFQAYKLGGIVAIGASRMGIDTCEKVKKTDWFHTKEMSTGEK